MLYDIIILYIDTCYNTSYIYNKCRKLGEKDRDKQNNKYINIVYIYWYIYDIRKRTTVYDGKPRSVGATRF